MRRTYARLLLTALVGLAAAAGSARAAHCGASASPVPPLTAEQSCLPAVQYRVVYQTVLESEPRVCYRPVYQTLLREVHSVAYKPVYEQQMRLFRYTVNKPCYEDHEVIQPSTVLQPV